MLQRGTMRGHALLRNPPLPRLRRRLRRDGDLRQARLRRGRDRRHAAGGPLRAGRRAVLGARWPRGALRELRALRAPRRRRRPRARRAAATRSRPAATSPRSSASTRRCCRCCSTRSRRSSPPRRSRSAASALDARRAGRAGAGAPAGSRSSWPAPGAGALDPLGVALGLGRRASSTAPTSSSASGIAGRVRAALLSALVCTGAAVTLTARLGAARRAAPGRADGRRLGLARLPGRRLDGRRDRLFFAGLRRVGPTTASILATVEPLVTVLLAFLVFGETLGGGAAAGGALVLWRALAAARTPAHDPRRRRQEHETD